MVTTKEVTSYLSFYKLPKALLKEEPYKSLSDRAHKLYMLLFDRLEMSVKNKWHDSKGKVFQYYPNEDLAVDLNCSEKSVIKAKRELITVGLLEEVRQGVNQANRLYVKPVSGTGKNTGQELENGDFGTVKKGDLELKNLQGNKTKYNKTKNNNNVVLEQVKEIMNYFNQITGRDLSWETLAYQKQIVGRLTAGYTVEQMKQVIDTMTPLWQNDSKMSRFLNPETLFRASNIDKYLDMAPAKQTTNKASGRLDF